MLTSRFTNVTEEQFAILIFHGLVSIFDTGSLCSFKAKVIRVLFQLESPNLEHRNSSYVQNNSDYSMIKTEIRIWHAHNPTLSEFLSHLEQEFVNVYFYMDVTEEQFAILSFLCLVSKFDTGSLCYFKAKVIRVLFLLESANSELRNASYVQNNSDYSMIKTEIRIWIAHGPTLSDFLSNLEQEFDNVHFYMDGSTSSLF